MNDFDSEIIEKAKSAESVEELLEIAKANNVEITAEDASAYFAQLNPRCGELNDDELDNVAGGACSQASEAYTCPHCGSVLTRIDFCDGIDPVNRPYLLCYGCRSYGLWYGSYGWEALPENRAKYLVEETSGQ